MAREDQFQGDMSRNEVEIDLDKYMAMIEKLDEQEDQIKEMKEEARLAAEQLGPRKRKFMDLFLDDNDLKEKTEPPCNSSTATLERIPPYLFPSSTITKFFILF